jgi:hypothetical protein
MHGAPDHSSGFASRISVVLLAAATTLLAGQEAPEEPGPELIREVAAKAEEFKIAREQYTYRQTVAFQELDIRGGEVGRYQEVRDVIFNPRKERLEVLVGQPRMQLRNLRLTEEDFRDIREVKPFVLTRSDLGRYHVRFRGREAMDGADCFVFQVTPRQILDGMRLFDGRIWVSVSDRQIIRAEGRPVPQIYRSKGENLFPHFTTLYRPIDGQYWFPVRTLADDTLPFRTGPQRVRLIIRYDDYKRFTADTSIEFEAPKQ